MSSSTTALQGETMLESPAFSVILAIHPEVNGSSSTEASVLLTPKAVQVPAGRGLTVGRPCDEAIAHYDHVTIEQGIIGTLPVGIVPQRALNLTPVRLPGGDAAIAASLSTSHPDYWSITSPGKRTGPDVWHRLYHDDQVRIFRRESIRDEWEIFLRAQILSKSIERPQTGAGTGTLLLEKAHLERAAATMAGQLRRDLFDGDIRDWNRWALVLATMAYLYQANKTDNLQDRLNAVIDCAPSANSPTPSPAGMAAGSSKKKQNTQFMRPEDAFRILRVRYDSLAPASLEGYSFQRLFGITPPSGFRENSRRLFYRQLRDAQIVTKAELEAVAPYAESGARP